MTESQLCRVCNERPRAPRYTVCQRCRHGAPVPCPQCGGPKRPESAVCRPCHKLKRGPEHGCWRGGRTLDGYGYVRVWAPQDSRANCGRYMKEHVLVMEAHLGRQLWPGENVHHLNGDRADNRVENLELWVTSQPPGQRPADLVQYAREILERYA